MGESVELLTTSITPTMASYAAYYSVPISEGIVGNSVFREKSADWVVFDGYHFDEETFERTSAEFQTLVIDDLADRAISADLVVNPNFGSEKLQYKVGVATRVLCGPEYAPLRPEFSADLPYNPEPKTLFVCLGGGDNTQALAELIAMLPLDWNVKLVPGRSRLPAALPPNIAVYESPQDMAELMRSCAKAIVNAGSTVWECRALGIPTALIKLHENQDIVARELSRADEVVWLNAGGGIDGKAIRLFLEDGTRAKTIFTTISLAALMKEASRELPLRLADERDVRAVWEINNDPGARANAVNPNPIPYLDHERWFASSLTSKSRYLWVLGDPGHVEGVVRVDFEAADGRISIALRPSARGKGLGKVLLGQATQRVWRMARTACISAVIKPANVASIKLFEGLGFQMDSELELSGEVYLLYKQSGPNECV
jgi:spore coat polysaccharide biosynthesis predicted glycosyltransferase SpsG/L-amino acid N-acyltransferase YncA